MSRQSSAWMPLYIGDYLGDTQRLTTEQHGAYLLLILDYWRNGPAPDDDAVLQQITKLERASWKKHRPALSRMFQITDGEWRHKRIDKELSEAEANAERRSSKAKAAAEARWGDAPRNARSMPQAMPGACPPQSPSPKVESSEANASGDKAAADEIPVVEPDPPAKPPTPPPPDPAKVMFDAGLRMFAEEGKSEQSARALLGKWRQRHGPEAVIVALGKAQREGAIDLTSFIEGCLKNGNDRKSGTDRDRRGDGFANALREVASSQAPDMFTGNH